MTIRPASPPQILWPREVSTLLGLDSKSIRRLKPDDLRFFKTPGGHRRCRLEDVGSLIAKTLHGTRTVDDLLQHIWQHPADLLNGGEAARLYGYKAVDSFARAAGKRGGLQVFRLPGGHFRYLESDLLALRKKEAEDN